MFLAGSLIKEVIIFLPYGARQIFNPAIYKHFVPKGTSSAKPRETISASRRRGSRPAARWRG
jgi:hypothetical protein